MFLDKSDRALHIHEAVQKDGGKNEARLFCMQFGQQTKSLVALPQNTCS